MKGQIFSGELMRCVMCGKEETASAEVESGWRAIVLGDESRYYVCPGEMPEDGAGKEAFEEAYVKVFTRIVELRQAEQGQRDAHSRQYGG